MTPALALEGRAISWFPFVFSLPVNALCPRRVISFPERVLTCAVVSLQLLLRTFVTPVPFSEPFQILI